MGNSFESHDLEMLFRTLHDRTGMWDYIDMDEKWIDISRNPGALDCNTDEAVIKGWEVRKYE